VTAPLDRLASALGDRYALERQVGEGGMATVYLARDLKHERKVAIKVLRPELSVSLGADRFLREIRVAANLQHPNILGLYDSGECESLLYYVMPFVEGESLRDRLNKEQQLPIHDSLQIVREAADALQYAHERGIVHRDIKPENILLLGGHALVADFGIARAVTQAGGDKLTQTGMAVGTPAYMSPEQSLGSDHVDARSDVYSLGCVLYEILIGQPPFTGPNSMAIMARHSMEVVPSL
jgi:eukaryotic-like serine/threonine-protein kinase